MPAGHPVRPHRAALVFVALLLATALAAWTLPLGAALAQSDDTEVPSQEPAEPQLQIPQEIEADYNDQMSLEEVIAECHAILDRIEAELGRLTTAITPFEASHPAYYVAEKLKIDSWFSRHNEAAEMECDIQKDAAIARQTPPSPTPGNIDANYHDQMSLEEVETECGTVKERILAEFDRLIGIIDPFEGSHPEYHATEKAQLEDWLNTTEAAAETACGAQREAAIARQPPIDIDDLYPHVAKGVKELANQLGLTDVAKEILYELDTELFDDPDHPDFSCNKNSLTEVYIYGCWHPSGEIKILNDNAVATTLAHELLHAIYYEYYLNDNEAPLNALIDAAATANPVQAHIILQAYSERLASVSPPARRYIRHTELYAFIGTQFTNIPQALEDHYARYFSDRREVLNIFHSWVLDTRAKLTEREAYNKRLLAQLDEYLECLNDTNAPGHDCQSYQAPESQYAAYDQCLDSRKTFLRDCRQLRPPPPLLYQPAPELLPSQLDDKPENLEELIEETKQSAERANEEQEALEESFVHQLVFHDHDINEETVQPGAAADSQTATIDNDDSDGNQGEGEAEQNTDDEDAGGLASGRQVVVGADGDSGNQTATSSPGDRLGRTDAAEGWLLWVLGGGFYSLLVALLLWWCLRQPKPVFGDADDPASKSSKDAS